MANTKQVALRLPVDLLDRLDRCALKFRQDIPGSNITRTDVVRILLERGLAKEGYPPDGTSTPSKRAPKKGRAR